MREERGIGGDDDENRPGFADAGAGEFYARCGYVERGRTVFRTAPLIYFERLL